ECVIRLVGDSVIAGGWGKGDVETSVTSERAGCWVRFSLGSSGDGDGCDFESAIADHCKKSGFRGGAWKESPPSAGMASSCAGAFIVFSIDSETLGLI